MTRSALLVLALLAAGPGPAFPAPAAYAPARDAAPGPSDTGRIGGRPWAMTVAMGFGSDRRCALGGCEDAATAPDAPVARSRARVSMGYGSAGRCAPGGCADGRVPDEAVARNHRPA